LALSSRNALEPANRLPSANLSQVARYVSHHGGDSYTRAIIPLTHMCRHWREFIISTPENLATISNRCEKLTMLSLQRAKAASLDISLDMGVENPGLCEVLASHIQNIGHLYANGLSDTKDLMDASCGRCTPSNRCRRVQELGWIDRSV
jgi:hypothetical protein